MYYLFIYYYLAVNKILQPLNPYEWLASYLSKNITPESNIKVMRMKVMIVD